ncbi:MAG: hypothetical protein HN914_10005 [Candidatus Marinimicrobia bacterium]|nr:hypothetical protein [Candidatus Neomarinimicrobiota bacterium]MBT7200769.1 hypothetical protein [Candidatus Neomarinimicrobiota bacterium]
MLDVQSELEKLKLQTQKVRKKRYYKSRLDRYKGELLKLYQSGASVAELRRWLLSRRIKVVTSTVSRWIKKNA